MKIVYINTNYYPDMVGGTEVSLKKMAEGMASRGHDVMVICSSSQIKEDNVNRVDVKYEKSEIKGRIMQNICEFYNTKLVNKTVEWIKEFEPDIIHTNNIFPFSPVIWKKIHEMNIPIVHTVRDYYLMGSRFLLKRDYLKDMTKYVDVVTAASRFTLNKHIESNLFEKAKKTVVVNATEFETNELKQIKDYRFSLDKKIVDYGFVGRLTEEKGLKNLVEVFDGWDTLNRLHIFGKGNLEELVNMYVKRNPRIIFEGFVQQCELEKKLKNIDVLIVPTTEKFQEPFGRVVLDAYKQMIPVIASNVGGLPEVVSHRKTGLLFNPSNGEELLNSMKWFDNRKNITNMFDNIEKKINEYGIDYQLDEFQKIYDELVL